MDVFHGMTLPSALKAYHCEPQLAKVCVFGGISCGYGYAFCFRSHPLAPESVEIGVLGDDEGWAWEGERMPCWSQQIGTQANLFEARVCIPFSPWNAVTRPAMSAFSDPQPHALAQVILALAQATADIADIVRTGSSAKVGSTNSFGDAQLEMDVRADNAVFSRLRETSTCLLPPSLPHHTFHQCISLSHCYSDLAVPLVSGASVPLCGSAS